jgi:hypothetical protein
MISDEKDDSMPPEPVTDPDGIFGIRRKIEQARRVSSDSLKRAHEILDEVERRSDPPRRFAPKR